MEENRTVIAKIDALLEGRTVFDIDESTLKSFSRRKAGSFRPYGYRHI